MVYDIGQALGLVGGVCGLILPMLKKKSQMLVMTMGTNGTAALNLLLIGRPDSACMIHSLAVVQALVSLWHVRRDAPVIKGENGIFMVLYIACGLMGYQGVIDLLPIVGSLFNMLATFQRDVQKTRVLILINVSFFLVYYVIIRSTSVFMVLSSILTTLIAMYRHGKNAVKA